MMKCPQVSVGNLSPLACPEQKAASQAGPGTKRSMLLSLCPACSGTSTLRALTTPEQARVQTTVQALSPLLAIIRWCQVWPLCYPGLQCCWECFGQHLPRLSLARTDGALGGEKGGEELPVFVCCLWGTQSHQPVRSH